jgi:hypothetical protein
MWPEIKTRKCFSRLASGADADRRPAAALARRLRTGVPVVRISPSRCGGSRVTCLPAGVMEGVHADRLERHAGSRRSRSLITYHPSPITCFLIETPRLEFRATGTKQRPDSFSNRDRLAFFHAENPLSFNRRGGQAFWPFPLTNHKSPVARLFREEPPRRTASHAFLIYGAAIRIPRKS